MGDAGRAARAGASGHDLAPGTAVRRSLGALLPSPATRAIALSIPLASARARRTSLPLSVNLVKRMPAVRDQGNRGTCVAFCLTAVHEYRDRRLAPDYSERHLYFEAKSQDGMPEECGTTQEAAAGVLHAAGQCRERLWPYEPEAACVESGTRPPRAGADGRRHRLELRAVNPRDVMAIRTALAAGRPAGISIPVYNSWYQSPVTERTGRITLPIDGEHEVGGHCVCLVGYVDDSRLTVTPTPGGGFFILRNSWGAEWGADCPFGPGYGTIPYGYIAAFNWEGYTLAA